MGAEGGQEQSYQWMLRALGAFLDEEPSCRLSLSEVPDGFLVRMQRALHKLDPKVMHFKRETLVEQLAHLMQQRPSAASRARHQGIWAHFPNGHQDFLRALGFELDQASAHGILIDELEDGIVLTYNYPDPETGAWRKRLVVLGLAEIEEILNAAFERRQRATSREP
jgi:hypothetical protein